MKPLKVYGRCRFGDSKASILQAKNPSNVPLSQQGDLPWWSLKLSRWGCAHLAFTRGSHGNVAAPGLFPSIMQRRHPECLADSCTLSASIAKSSHQTCSPGHLRRCSFAAILSVVWHLVVDTEFRQQKGSADSLESLYSNKEQKQKAFPFRFPFNTVFKGKSATRGSV